MICGPTLTLTALAGLLPMHLWIRDQGDVMSVGPTLAKVLPNLHHGLWGQVVPLTSMQGSCPLQAIHAAVDQNVRLFLRSVTDHDLVLRGHGMRLEDHSVLLNFGFGIGLHDAVRGANLTDNDFAPSELAMELLFLHEANRAVLTELSRFNKRLEQSRETAFLQAHTDPLTGLSNRRGLEMALSLALRAAEDGFLGAFAVIHLDLDHFKPINDQLGHKAGDDVLVAVGAVLRDHVRKADTAARIGGDEFVLLLNGMTSRSALLDLANRIIDAIRKLSPPNLVNLDLSASLGVLIWTPGSANMPDAILALADTALYQSKNAGRGCATILGV